MLKRLFTSKARLKLLQLFVLNPDEEYFIRELTRKLDEQINSVRRELDNLKKMGLLRSRARNRKKFYVVNKQFLIFNELRSIFMKAGGATEDIAKHISRLGNIDLLIFSGLFVDRPTPADILIVGNIDQEELSAYLSREVESDRPIKFSVLSKDDFLYRMKCHDKFVSDLLRTPENITAVNRLHRQLPLTAKSL